MPSRPPKLHASARRADQPHQQDAGSVVLPAPFGPISTVGARRGDGE